MKTFIHSEVARSVVSKDLYQKINAAKPSVIILIDLG